VILGPYH